MYRLYWAPDTAAFAPHVVLEEAGAPYGLVPVDLEGGEQYGADYQALNPGGYVPTLVTEDGQVITESAAIALSLAERHPEAGLLPELGTPERGTVLRWLFYLTNTVQEAYKRYYYPDRYLPAAAEAPKIKAKAISDLKARWRPVDAHLAAAGPFVPGSRFSVADVYLVMLATWFEPPEALFADCRAVRRCFELAAERPALRRTLDAHGQRPP